MDPILTGGGTNTLGFFRPRDHTLCIKGSYGSDLFNDIIKRFNSTLFCLTHSPQSGVDCEM